MYPKDVLELFTNPTEVTVFVKVSFISNMHKQPFTSLCSYLFLVQLT